MVILADFELQDDNGTRDENNNVDPLPHSRNCILECHIAIGIQLQMMLQNVDLCEPSITLKIFEGEVVMTSECAQHAIGILLQKVRRVVGVVCSIHPSGFPHIR